MQGFRVRREHTAQVGQVTVFYTTSFDVGKRFPISTAAQRLMDIELAEMATIPPFDEVWLAPRYKDLELLVTKGRSLIEAEAWINGNHTPNLSWRSRVVIIQTLAKVYFARLTRRQQKIDRVDCPAEDDVDMKNLVQDINESVVRGRELLEIQAQIDELLYEPGQLHSIPHIRLQLRHFLCSDNKIDPESDGDESVILPEVTLTLHQSGVCLLTIAIRMPEPHDANQIDAAKNPNQFTIRHSLVSEPVLRSAAKLINAKRDTWPGTWHSELAEGVRWMAFDHTVRPSSLSDMINLYVDAIRQEIAVERQNVTWATYSTVFYDNLLCCKKRSRWLKNHGDEVSEFFVGAPKRSKDESQLATGGLLDEDYSTSLSESVWLAGGSTVCLAWNFSEPDGDLRRYFYWLAITENAVLRYWQLRTIDRKISEVQLKRTEVEALLASTIEGMRDYGHPYMRLSNANEVSVAISGKLGGDPILRSIEIRLQTLQSLVAIRESGEATRRANRFAATAVLAAIFLGLPAIKQSLDVLQKLETEGFLENLRKSLLNDDSINATATTLYLILLSCGLVFVFTRVRVRRIVARIRRSFNKKFDLRSRWNNGGYTSEERPGDPNGPQ